MLYTRYLDLTWPVQHVGVIPYAGRFEGPDVWSEEAIACIIERIHASSPAKKELMSKSRIWKGVKFVPYNCYNARLPWTDDIYVFQADGLDGVVNSSCRLAGFYTMVDSIPCMLSVCCRRTVMGHLTGFVYHPGEWFERVSEHVKRLYAIDSTLKRLEEGIEASLPDWRSASKRTDCPEVPFEEHVQPYLARMHYFRSVWQSYLELKKCLVEFLWKKGNVQDVVNGAQNIAELSESVAECVREKAVELESAVIEFKNALEEQS